MLNDDLLKKRLWLFNNFEWFANEIAYHREMSKYFKNNKVIIWHLTDETESVTYTNIAELYDTT